MGIYERIKEVAKEKGYSINRLEKELGFARSSIGKFNKNMPGTDKVQAIADLLGVSLDYLMGSDNKQLTEKEQMQWEYAGKLAELDFDSDTLDLLIEMAKKMKK